MSRWPKNKAHWTERAPFFKVLVPVILGITAFTRFHNISLTTIVITALLALILFSLSSINRHVTAISDVARFASMNLLFVCIAWSLAYCNDARTSSTWFGHDIDSSKGYLVRVTDGPDAKEHTWKLKVKVLAVVQRSAVDRTTGDAFVYVYKDAGDLPFSKGDTLLLPGKWEPIKNAGNPFEFDYAGYCARNNLYYQQFLQEDEINVYSRTNGNKSILDKTHEWGMRQLGTYIPDSSSRGLIQAMLLGDEVNLDPSLRQSYSATGIVHIIAISGGNISVFFVVVSALLWWLKHKKYKWVKYIVALPLIWFYVLMAGAPPSAVRAAIMFSVLAIGFSLEKDSNSLNQLFATAVLLLCAEPMWLYSIGFQLSFIAVLSLILFYQPIYGSLQPGNKILNATWKVIAASIAAEILVAPIVIYYFHLLPVTFILANMAALVFMSTVLILGISILAVSFAPALASSLGMLTIWIVKAFNQTVHFLERFNPRAFYYLRLSEFELFLAYLSIGSIALFVLQKKKPVAFAALVSICILMMCFIADEWHASGQEALIVYNISRSAEIELIRGNQHFSLFTDSLLKRDKKDYVQKPVYANLMCHKEGGKISTQLLSVGRKRVLLLNDKADDTLRIPVDYVIVNYPLDEFKADVIKEQFAPGKVVIGNVGSRKQVAKCLEQCKKCGLPAHALAYDGAFILGHF